MSQNLRRLCPADSVPEQGVRQVAISELGQEFAVYRLNGEFFATDDLCTHGMVSLSNGDVENGRIHCPLHGGVFDIRTGAPLELPCRIPLKTYKVTLIDGELFAEVL
jgi:nitrite reductase/ring-hydroxylating ferredoxin subunit